MTSAKTFTLNLKRVIAGPPAKVYDAWLDPQRPGGPWHGGKPLILNPKVPGLFYVMMRFNQGVPHFGRFTALARGRKIQHTWMSPYTHGLESEVTLTFKKHAAGTLVSLRHSGLPNDDDGRGHEDGWGYFLGLLEKRFGKQG